MKTVLIIENSSDFSALMCVSAIRNGYNPVVAFDGHEAIDLLDSETFDLVISDLSLPGHSGVELLHELRGFEDTCDVPVVLYVSHTTPKQWRSSRVLDSYGIRKIVEKSEITPLQLFTELNNFL